MSEIKWAELWVRRPNEHGGKPYSVSFEEPARCPTCGSEGLWVHHKKLWPEHQALAEAYRLARESGPEGVHSVWVQRGDEVLCAAGEKAKELADAGVEVALP